MSNCVGFKILFHENDHHTLLSDEQMIADGLAPSYSSYLQQNWCIVLSVTGILSLITRHQL